MKIVGMTVRICRDDGENRRGDGELTATVKNHRDDGGITADDGLEATARRQSALPIDPFYALQKEQRK